MQAPSTRATLEMSIEITPMTNRALPIALGAAVAFASFGAFGIPAANAFTRNRPHHHPSWRVPPAAAAMAGAGILMNGIANIEQATHPVYQQPVYVQPMPVMAPVGW